MTSATSEEALEILFKFTFLKLVHSKNKMRHVSAFSSKFSLNLSTEEVCICDKKKNEVLG
jgi:hypothetical protein